ncbi:MAG: NmrA family NAD(P)-binding protein [Phycisphaerales bacterium]
MRILVAGASGALGRLIVQELESRGHTVRATVRRLRSASAMPGARCT